MILKEYCYKHDLVSDLFYNGAFIGGEPLNERGRELEHFWYLRQKYFF